jgi:exonuclease III
LTNSILSNFGGVDLNSLNAIYSLGNDNPENFEPNFNSHSDYYDIDNLNSIPSISTSFSIFSLNVQSLRTKVDAIRIFLNDLLSSETTFDALCFQETWLDANDDLSGIKLDGYKLIHRPKSCSAHGGLAIYICDHYVHDVFHMTSTNTNWEGLFIKVHLQYTHLIIGNVYRQPNNHNNGLSSLLTNLVYYLIRLAKIILNQ